jgi:AraC-like DNA-binding protein
MAASPVGGRREARVDRRDLGLGGVYTEGMTTAQMQTISELEDEYLGLIAIRGIDPRSKHPEVDSRMRIDAAIAEGFDDVKFTITEVVLEVGLSERRIRDILAEDDDSFRGEVLKLRMSKARWLVADSNAFTVDEIAYLCGYRCASTFAARFREATGASPRAWRERYGGASRAGGTTGCFRSAAARARAAIDGSPAPGTRRPRPTLGERAMTDQAMRHSERRAILRGHLPRGASIADRARVWMGD